LEGEKDEKLQDGDGWEKGEIEEGSYGDETHLAVHSCTRLSITISDCQKKTVRYARYELSSPML